MKDYNQMAQAVFRRRDEYLAAQKKKKALILKVGVPVCSLVLVVILGITFWLNKLPQIPSLPTEPTGITENTLEGVTTSITQEQTAVSTKPAENTQASTDPQKVESAPFLPEDPVEKPMDAPATSVKPDYVVDATSAMDGEEQEVPPASPNDPGAPPSSGGFPITRPDSPDVPTTEAPTVDDPDWGMPDGAGDPTTPGDISDATEPTVQTDPTEPATGPVEILIGGVKCTAQTGDMVSYTAELYVKDLFESFAAAVVHSDNLEVVEVVDPWEEEAAPIHYPNLTGGGEMMNYHYNRINTDSMKRVFVLGSKLSGYNFKEQKVLFKFDFIVTQPGEAELALEIHDLCKKGDGTPYFKNRVQHIFEGIDFEEYLTVTPADEVVLPTAPKEEEVEPAPPFTYPAQSYDGDMLINCDDRTYAAELGHRVTYVVELEARQKFEDADIIVTYGNGLDLLVPEDTEEKSKEEVTAPNLMGAYIGYDTEYTVDDQTFKAVKFSVSRIPKYDFRRRKVLLQLDFIVAKPGEVELDLHITGMSINDTDSYFYKGEQIIHEGIEIYEYVMVH